MHYSLSTAGGQTVIIINVDAGRMYKKLEYDIDNTTGLLTKMITVVRADQLYEPAVRSSVTPGNTYAIIETLFTNYHDHGFDESLLDTGRYFTKQGRQYITIAPYNQYKIFLGNPGL